jgi:predicted transcriptional regulator
MSSCCSASVCGSPNCLQLTERESQVCETVCASPEGVTFSTLKETLGYHQEVVSRILKRLLNYRAIEKFRGKYRRVSQ